MKLLIYLSAMLSEFHETHGFDSWLGCVLVQSGNLSDLIIQIHLSFKILNLFGIFYFFPWRHSITVHLCLSPASTVSFITIVIIISRVTMVIIVSQGFRFTVFTSTGVPVAEEVRSSRPGREERPRVRAGSAEDLRLRSDPWRLWDLGLSQGDRRQAAHQVDVHRGHLRPSLHH